MALSVFVSPSLLLPSVPFCFFVYFPLLCVSLLCVSLFLVYVSLIALSQSCVSVSFCLLCVALSLLSESPHTVAKLLLRTGGFLPSPFPRGVCSSERDCEGAGVWTGLLEEQSRGQAEARVWCHPCPSSSPCDGALILTSPDLPHVMGRPLSSSSWV